MPALPNFNFTLAPEVAAGVLLLACAASAAYHLRRQRPVWWGSALAGVVMSVAVLLPMTGPQMPAPKQATPPPPVGTPQDNMYSRWLADRELWGEPIGECFTREQIVVCPMSVMFEGYHYNIDDLYWRIQGLNIGTEYAKLVGIELQDNPTLPTVMAAYLSQLSKRGIDTLYYFGNLRAGPVPRGDATWYVFDKAIVQIPSSSGELASDPAAVKRLPVGSWMYAIVTGGGKVIEPWTDARKILAGMGLLLLLVSLSPLVLKGLNQGLSPASDW